jgi:hypothetical protein
MRSRPKTSQLQIRVSPAEKAAIQRAADEAGMDMSAFVLRRVLPESRQQFQALVAACAGSSEPGFALAELNSFLARLTAAELRDALGSPIEAKLSDYLANYTAAMLEYACARLHVAPPPWVHRIPPLAQPVFETTLQSLRLYLLAHSPPPFRRRNIFIDATVGARV